MQSSQTNIKTEKTTVSMDSSQPTEPMAKRLKPHEDPDQDQTPVHCPRCDSTNTKFCYYNNYSLSQPRYFCKSCRRYWTKGGTLRNIPVGGVSRRNKKVSSVSAANHHHQLQPLPHYNKLAILPDVNAITRNSTGLQLSNSESPTEFSSYPDFMFDNLTIDFMEMGSGHGGENEGGDHFPTILENGYGADSGHTHGVSPFGQVMTYYHEHYDKMMNGDDMKPKFELETGCYSDLYESIVGRNGSTRYLPGIGSSWAGLMNGYGSSSTTNSLV